MKYVLIVLYIAEFKYFTKEIMHINAYFKAYD